MDRKENEARRNVFGKTPIIGIVILVVVVGGLMVDAIRADGEGNDTFYSDIIRLDNMATTIHQNYVEDMPSKDLIDNAIQGMLQILDPHTTYFDSKDYDELKIHTEGKFGGLGIQISIRDKTLTVMTPIQGTPAERAGIQSGDQIIKIDGKPTTGMSIDRAVEKLRGEPGTTVQISIRRKGEVKDMDYTVTREIIHIKSVPYYGVIGDNVGYVYLQTFSQEAGTDVEKAVRELLKQNVKAMVFDLRHNPGGLLPEAIKVADKFLPNKSLVVSTRGRVKGQNQEFYSEESPVLPADMPLAVLVDYASASASEIVSGAIQDWDRGVIVGDTTFGKGSVQTIIPLDKTHHLKLTEAFYYTPSGRCINRPENAVRGSSLKSDEADSSGNPEDQDESGVAVKDSISKAKKDTTVYRTKNKRIVYGGGGIIPDTVVKQQIPGMVIRSLFGKDVFFQFANLEYPRLKKQKAKIEKNFTITEPIMKDFYQYLDSIKFVYQSLSQMKYDEFKKIAGLDSVSDTLAKLTGDIPKWNAGEMKEIAGISQQMDAILKQESKRTLSQNESDIRKYLREAFLIREFGQDNDTYYQAKLSEDPQLKTALGILSNKSIYTTLLTTSRPASPSGASAKTTK